MLATEHAPGPTEWTTGESRVPYFLAFFCFLLVLYWIALLGVPWLLFGAGWAQGGFPRFLLELAVGLMITFPWALLWAITVPMPPHRIGIDPEGAILDWGARLRRYSRPQLMLHNRVLYARQSRWLPPFPVAVSTDQLERLTHLWGIAPPPRPLR